MRLGVINKIESYVGLIYEKLKDNDDRITICAIGTSQYLNYLVEKGIILSSEKAECSQIVVDYLEKKFDSEIFEFIKNGLLDLMQAEKTYDYETIGYFVRKVDRQNI